MALNVIVGNFYPHGKLLCVGGNRGTKVFQYGCVLNWWIGRVLLGHCYVSHSSGCSLTDHST